MVQVMVDLETMGTGPDARVVQIGACTFDAKEIGAQHFNVYVTDDAGSVDNSTFSWWLEQSEDARIRLSRGMRNGVPAIAAAGALRHWYQSLGEIDGVWAWPSSFDFPILESFFRRHNMSAPWSYRRIRDARTLREVANLAPSIGPYYRHPSLSLVAHDAVDDCLMQSHEVRGHMLRLGVWQLPLDMNVGVSFPVIGGYVTGRDLGDENG